jgi:hypothetical protein
MSDVLDRIRRELQQRLESTRAAAQEHERVRAALDALEEAAKPFERATRRAASEAGRRGRSLADRTRHTTSGGGLATGAANASGARTNTTTQHSSRARKTASATRGGSPARSSKAKAELAVSKPRSRARAAAKPARRRAARGANREAVLAVVRERPGVTTRELAAASGVTGGTLYSLLSRLNEQGELAKRELPGGQTGYALPSGGAAVSGGVSRPAGSEDSAQTRAAEAATESGRPSDPRISGSPDPSE